MRLWLERVVAQVEACAPELAVAQAAVAFAVLVVAWAAVAFAAPVVAQKFLALTVRALCAGQVHGLQTNHFAVDSPM